MNRRDFLFLSALGTAGLSGCFGNPSGGTPTSVSNPGSETPAGAGPTPTDTMTRTATPVQQMSPTEYVRLTDFTSGTGSWDDPYTSESGTAGLDEVLAEHGTAKPIVAPTGTYSFTSAFETEEWNLTIIGMGQGVPRRLGLERRSSPGESEDSEEDSSPFGEPEGTPDSTIFRLDYEPSDPFRGAIIHAPGSGQGGGQSMVMGWHLEGIRFLNGDEYDATAIGMSWAPFQRIDRLSFGGLFSRWGFRYGLNVDSIFKFIWSNVYGMHNHTLIRSAGDFNQGVVTNVQGGPTNKGYDEKSAVMHLADRNVGRIDNLAAAKPRGLTLTNVGGGADRSEYGILLEGAFGVELHGTHIEAAKQAAVKIDSGIDDVKSRSVGVLGGFYIENGSDPVSGTAGDGATIEVDGAIDTEIDGAFIQDSPGASMPKTGIKIGENAEHTTIDRVTFHETIETPVRDDGVGTIRDGVGTADGEGPPPAGDWQRGDIVEATGSGALYQLKPSGSWGRIT